MSKKIIKLSENDLHNIIKESVKKVISELDWKTYQNAAHKDYNPKRAKDFQQAAVDKFNDEYGYNDNDGNAVQLTDNGFKGKRASNLVITSKHGYKNNPTRFSSQNSNDPNDEYYNVYSNGRNSSSYSQEKKPFTQDKRHARNIQKAYNEYENYRNGNYEYDSENGWTKNSNNLDIDDFHNFLKYDDDED